MVNLAQLVPTFSKLRGDVAFDLVLKDYNTWHVGGTADCVFWPQDIADLSNFMVQLPETVPVTVLGLGSNVLIRDSGLRGVVIMTTPHLKRLDADAEYVIVEAGVPCAKLAKFYTSRGYGAGAFWAGIPGTIGGAVMMNAGAFGGETWTFVEEVHLLNDSGALVIINKDSCQYGYRYSNLPAAHVVVAVKLKLAAPLGTAITDIKKLLAKRAAEQPIGVFSCGSVFRNPPQDFAARLIDSSNLKNYRVGGAYVSPKHANFIINDKTASAQDIEQLLYHVRTTVAAIHNVWLEPEVKILG